MSAPTDRLICPRCGSNNFATQAACWKCGAPLASGGTASSGAAVAPPPPVSRPAFAAAAPARSVDPAIAVWAAAALAFFFPFVAVPAGLVFLMLDERRKADLGRIALIWGLVFSVLHFLLTWWLLAATIAQFRSLSPEMLGRLQEQRQSQPPPDPNTRVPPLQLPGIGP